MTELISLPPSQGATFSVRVFNLNPPGSIILPTQLFITPTLPGKETFDGPVFAFLLEHSITRKKYLFDLGTRKDVHNLPPSVAAMFTQTAFPFIFDTPLDIVDHLTQACVAVDSIDSIFWSHSHFDHSGNMSLFPKSVNLVIGEETVTVGYPTDPEGKVFDSDFEDRDVKIVKFSDPSSTLKIGPFIAVDFLGDASIFLLDVPGHCKGNMDALVRVTDDTFLLLGGDTCHHPAQLRPTANLHLAIPCPGELLETAKKTISGEYFTPVDADGKFNLEERHKPLLELPDTVAHEDVHQAKESLTKLAELDPHPNIFVLLAHDVTFVKLFSEGGENGDLPKQGLELKDWKEKGWKDRWIWTFVEQPSAVLLSPGQSES